MATSRLTYVHRKYLGAYHRYAAKNYAIAQAIAHLAKYQDERIPGSNNPYISEDDKRRVLDDLRKWALSSFSNPAISDLAAFELKALNKWVGPQGATPTHDEVMSVIAEYYDKADYSFNNYPEPSDAALANWVVGTDTNIEYDLLSPRAAYNRFKGDRKSTSALTGWTDRRTPGLASRAIQEAYTDNRFDPIVVGTRDQRCKIPCRCIFMDSFSNYYREVKGLYFLMDIWRGADTVLWRGERYFETTYFRFTRFQKKRYLHFEADYEMMDSWLTRNLFIWFINQLQKCYKLANALIDYILNDLSYQLFNVPLWTPEGEIRKEHSLLSGLYPTNPWETPMNALIQLMFIDKILPGAIYGEDFIIVINGDDSLIVFSEEAIIDGNLDQIDLKELFASWVWENFRIKARADKQRVSESSGFFCKRQYKRSGYQYSPMGEKIIRSTYSIALCWLTILYPEDGVLDSKAQSLIKLWQVFDGALGHPLWKRSLRQAWELNPDLHITVSDEDLEKFNSDTNKNWRRIIFGEKFNAENSESAKLWIHWSQSSN